MIKTPFFARNFLHAGSIKVPPKQREKARMLNLLDRSSKPINCLLKKTNTSNLTKMCIVPVASLFSKAKQWMSIDDRTAVNLIKDGFDLINPPLILCGKI